MIYNGTEGTFFSFPLMAEDDDDERKENISMESYKRVPVCDKDVREKGSQIRGRNERKMKMKEVTKS